MTAPRGAGESRWQLDLSVGHGHPCLPGHFPSEPIVPGVLLLDEVLHLLSGEADHWHIEQVKFHRVVRPEEPLTLRVQRQSDGHYAFEVLNERRVVSTGLLLAQPNATGAPSPQPQYCP